MTLEPIIMSSTIVMFFTIMSLSYLSLSRVLATTSPLSPLAKELSTLKDTLAPVFFPSPFIMPSTSQLLDQISSVASCLIKLAWSLPWVITPYLSLSMDKLSSMAQLLMICTSLTTYLFPRTCSPCLLHWRVLPFLLSWPQCLIIPYFAIAHGFLHRLMGYIGVKGLHTTVDGLQFDDSTLSSCQICARANIHRLPFPNSSSRRASTLLEQIHYDTVFVALYHMPMAISCTTSSLLTATLDLSYCSFWKPIMKHFLFLLNSNLPLRNSAASQSKFFILIMPPNLFLVKCKTIANPMESCMKRQYLTYHPKMGLLNAPTWLYVAWHVPCSLTLISATSSGHLLFLQPHISNNVFSMCRYLLVLLPSIYDSATGQISLTFIPSAPTALPTYSPPLFPNFNHTVKQDASLVMLEMPKCYVHSWM